MHGGGDVWSVRGAHVPVDAGAKAKITDFTKLFWANRGNHNELTSQKFLPEFTFEELKQAALSAQKNGAFATASGNLSPIKTPVKLNQELENLRASLFDPNFEPMITAKNPGSGLDGFVEIYRDARGAKASAQSFVSITDKPLTDTMIRLGDNVNYFEERAPWDSKYKKQTFRPPVVKAIETLIETGDFSVGVIGDNLPNENEIHEKYGTKNFLFTSSTRALNDATGQVVLKEFAANAEIAERGAKYGNEAEDLMTALHEVIGHGSGKLSDRLKGGAEPYLKGYFSTLEEARADLSALWNAWDPKLKELGLLSNREEIAKAMYDSAVLAPLTQLRRIPKGETIEEDHQRDRQLIVNCIRARVPGAIDQFDRDAKTYIQVQDYAKMREGVGMLLTELMRIKAEGDYGAIKALVDQYALHFDPALRDKVVARYKKLDIPTYWAGINAELRAPLGTDGRIQNVELRYPADATQQYLAYGAMYDRSLLPTANRNKRAHAAQSTR